jgi:hypothetical protein
MPSSNNGKLHIIPPSKVRQLLKYTSLPSPPQSLHAIHISKLGDLLDKIISCAIRAHHLHHEACSVRPLDSMIQSLEGGRFALFCEHPSKQVS